jgi:hypothetical protein
MIDKFFSLFQNSAVHKIALLTGVCSQVIRTFEQEFAQDANSKDAAIDTLIDLLQRHKTSAPAQAPAVPADPVPNSIPVA